MLSNFIKNTHEQPLGIMLKFLTSCNVTSFEGSFQGLPETPEKLRLKLNMNAVTDVIYSFSIYLITDMSRFAHTH